MFSLQSLEVKDILAIKLSHKRVQVLTRFLITLYGNYIKIIQRPHSLSILPISLSYREIFGNIAELIGSSGDYQKICITQNPEGYHSELDDFIESLPIKHELERISVRKISQFKEKIFKLLV